MLARIENNQIVELREGALLDVPVHKREYFLEVEGVQPDFSPAKENLAGPFYKLENGKAIRYWNIIPRSEIEQKQAIKIECARRILALYPDWKQINMIARAVELTRKGNTLTEAEQAEAVALQASWDKVKALRSASDALELTLPADYTDNKWWPA